LNLSDNDLSGSIPSSYFIPSQLNYISLTRNIISGVIPDAIGNFSSLGILLLAQNNIQGNIPGSITKIPNLQVLDLSYNNLTGSVPQKLYNITNLTYLGLGVNQLVGRIPSDIGNTLPNIQTIVLEGNKFEGPLPVSLVAAYKHQALQFRDNAFTGVVPSYWSLPDLVELDLGANQLEAVDWSTVSIAKSSTQLQRIYLDNNKIQGTLPNSIGFLTRLEQLFPTENNFT
jgi:Leucine-rich repeat (LRR) protein